MSKNSETERRTGGRFAVSLPIKVSWQDETGKNVVEEGMTENVGVDGTLIHLPRVLPPVGSQVQIAVFEIERKRQLAAAGANVLRLMRNPAHPQVALKLADSIEDWRVKIFENEEVRLAAIGTPEEFED